MQSYLRVRYADTDAMGVVYHARYLEYFETGRGDWMRYHGVPYTEFERRGLFMPVVECHCRWRASAKYDELLTVETALAELSPAKLIFAYQVLRNEDRRLLCDGRTIHAFTDFSGRPHALPKKAPDIYATLQNLFAADQAKIAGDHDH